MGDPIYNIQAFKILKLNIATQAYERELQYVNNLANTHTIMNSF